VDVHGLPYCMCKIEEENRVSFGTYYLQVTLGPLDLFVLVQPKADEGIGGDRTDGGVEAGRDGTRAETSM
jgi:hypothetical protein